MICRFLIKNFQASSVLILGVLFRLFLICYARIHDYLFELPFTDVDYKVFSDASELVWQGRSPYIRHTYRYTPLLAWVLLPNRYAFDFGKLLFCLFDVISGCLQFKILCLDDYKASYLFFWILNPFAILSARGSSDSLVVTFILGSLFLLKANKTIFSAIIIGFAIHWKLYALIYLPSVYLSLSRECDQKKFFHRIFNLNGAIYAFVSLLTFFTLLASGYLIYGEKFVDRYLFYHLDRVDIKHNFSAYFYAFYLSLQNTGQTFYLSKMSFIPQVVCIVSFAFKFYFDLPLCWFLTTFAFVSLNKVSTSQYFLWYMAFFPIIYIRTKNLKILNLSIFVFWLFGQSVWLFMSYLLEFRGVNTFFWIWLSSLFFTGGNFFIMVVLSRTYELKSQIHFIGTKGIKSK